MIVTFSKYGTWVRISHRHRTEFVKIGQAVEDELK